MKDNTVKDYDVEFFTKDLEEIKQFEENYFKYIIDFLKWTTTFSLAAIVWIVSSFKIIGVHSNFFQLLSLLFLVFSIVVSILIIYAVIFLAGYELDIRSMFNNAFAKARIIKDTEEQEKISRYPYGKYQSYILALILPRFPYQFNLMILFHLLFLLIGVLFYMCSLLFV